MTSRCPRTLSPDSRLYARAGPRPRRTPGSPPPPGSTRRSHANTGPERARARGLDAARAPAAVAAAANRHADMTNTIRGRERIERDRGRQQNDEVERRGEQARRAQHGSGRLRRPGWSWSPAAVPRGRGTAPPTTPARTRGTGSCASSPACRRRSAKAGSRAAPAAARRTITITNATASSVPTDACRCRGPMWACARLRARGERDRSLREDGQQRGFDEAGEHREDREHRRSDRRRSPIIGLSRVQSDTRGGDPGASRPP